MIELQRQRSLEIEAHLAQVRLLQSEHLRQVEHIQDSSKSCELQGLWPVLCSLQVFCNVVSFCDALCLLSYLLRNLMS